MSSAVQISAPQTPSPSTSLPLERAPSLEQTSLAGELLIVIPILICLALVVYVLAAVPAAAPRPTVTDQCVSSTGC